MNNMKATLTFEYLYEQPFDFDSESGMMDFFKEMKERVCHDLWNKNVPLLSLHKDKPSLERIEVLLVESSYIPTDDHYQYKASFQIVGTRTKTVYDTIDILLEDVQFLTRVSSIDEYLSSIFKMRYSGFLMKKEDIEHYCSVSGKTLENKKLYELKGINEIENLMEETYRDKVRRMTNLLKNTLKNKSFEVYYTLMGTTQSFLYFYDEQEQEDHLEYLTYLVERTRTHQISFRIIENEIYEMFLLANDLYKPNIRKNKIYTS